MTHSFSPANVFPDPELNHQITFADAPNFITAVGQIDFDPNEAFHDICTTHPFPSQTASPQWDAQTPSGFSPEHNSNSYQQETSTALPNASSRIEMIAQPYYGAKLRYRSDYDKNDHRQGVLKNRTKNSSYVGPAIRIPRQYLDPNDQYYIRVCLVTAVTEKSNLRYIHPYTLEHPSEEAFNDRPSNSVCFPIQDEDCETGIKSFPLIRIVKKVQDELKRHGSLQAFHNYDADVQNKVDRQIAHLAIAKRSYEVDKSQLAFTVVKKLVVENHSFIIPESGTTVFSAVMMEGDSLESDSQNDNPSSAGSTKPSVAPCRVYKYAPRYSLNTDNEDMIVILTNKLEPKRYGALKVTFEYNMVNGHWSQSVTNIDVKDRVVSFKTPKFPYQFNETVQVSVTLQQDNRTIGVLTYFYISTLDQCLRCQLNVAGNQIFVIPNTPNKRSASSLIHVDDVVFDSVKPDPEGLSSFRQSLSEPVPTPSSPPPATVPHSAPVSPMSAAEQPRNPSEEIMKVLTESVESLFKDNDYTRLFRICRSFVRKRPQLLHEAIIKNHADLLSKFIPVASVDILQEKNDGGENVLVHAVRLDRVEIVKAILEKAGFEALMHDLDQKGNNLFHLMASCSPSIEMLDLIVDTLVEKRISMREKFDCSNHDHRTPLQLSITKNNLMVTKKILQHFRTDICALKDRTGDNIIHLAVRHGDVGMIRYIIEGGRLEQLGNQSNLTMTPTELARSLQRNDMVDYFHSVYPPPELSDDTSGSDSDESD